jgi:hypothetical protein
MLSPAEKKFIRDWEIQKEGPRWQYYLQYIFAWTTVTFLSLFFLIKVIISERNMGGWTSFLIVLFISILLASIITHLVYQANEKKLRRLASREAFYN